MAQRLSNLAAWWHLLSLDAPTVAALWAWFFAHAMHLRFAPLQAFPLALATWLLYVSDRILDGLYPGNTQLLRERHHFHARHRVAFLIAGSLLLAFLVWVVVTHMRPEALRDNLILGLVSLAYLLAVHHRRTPRLPKELAVALLFAAATAVPAWSRLGAGLGKEQLAPAVLFFAGLCWVNCVGIEKWESGQVHATSRWAGLHLRAIVTTIALFSFAGAVFAPSRGLMAVYLSALLSSVLLFLLDARSKHWSALHLRIAADAALLTPLAMLTVGR